MHSQPHRNEPIETLAADNTTNSNRPELTSVDRPTRRKTIGLSVLEVLLIFSVIFVYAGDSPPMVNEAHYLVKAKNFWQPDWCEKDLFVSSGKAHTTFYAVFGWPTRFVSLATTAWIGRIVGWLLLAVGIQRLCHVLLLHPFASLAVTVLWIAAIEYGNLAGEWIFGGIEAKVPAYGFVLLSLADIAQRKWNRAWVLMGIASAFHVLSGGWSVVAACIAWLMTERKRTDRQPLISVWLLAGGLIALLGIVPALWLSSGTGADDSAAAARIYTYFRLRHHLLPGDLLPSWYLRHGTLLVTACLLAWLLRNESDDLMRLCWKRGLTLWRRDNFSGISRLAGEGQTPFQTEPSNDAGERWSRISGFAIGSILIALVGFVLGVLPYYAPDLAAKLLRFYWFRLSDAVVALWFALLVVRCFHQQRHWGLYRYFATAWLSVAVVLVCFSSWNRMRLGVPPSASNRLLGWDVDAPPERQQKVFKDWLAVCDWIRVATEPDEVFLTPRHQQTFKWYAERAEVVNWKDVPQDVKTLLQWRNRFREVYPQRLGTVRVSIQYSALMQLRDKYGARYVVIDRRVTGEHSAMVRVYPIGNETNETYAVYELPHALP